MPTVPAELTTIRATTDPTGLTLRATGKVDQWARGKVDQWARGITKSKRRGPAT